MSATKAHLMSAAVLEEAEYRLYAAERRYATTCAACALAAHRVDAATLDDITFEAARDLGDAHERLAISRGYDGVMDMLR